MKGFEVGNKISCTKSLYKSTYKSNAFTNGQDYTICDVEDRFVWLIDDESRRFNFSITDLDPACYKLKDYFSYL